MLQHVNWPSTLDPTKSTYERTDVPQTLHEAFAAQAARTPDAVAVQCGERRLSYRQLNTSANQLASRLRGMDIGPESLVGVAVERSPEMIVAILGILKAGGAYLPLDCAYPRQRLDMILKDAGVAALVTQSTLLERLPALTVPHLCLDADRGTICAPPTDEAPNCNTPHHAAYVIYTSGSTGIPKGVAVTHENVMRLFTATQPWFNFNNSDVWTLFHSVAFDFSVWEIWGALLYGGRLVIVSWEMSRSSSDFYALLRRERVTVLNQTPSAFRQLIQTDAAHPGPHELALRYVIFGGEALDLRMLQPWYDRHGDGQPQLVNMYGITETTVHVTYRPISASDVAAGCGSVIGVPIPDLEVLLLDDKLQPVEAGTAGEIFVGGAGVARGYLNRPELTEERFIRHPYSANPLDRLYRSGDLARRTPDGDLEYLGRIDHQVKIRGFRIELGEIEAGLNGHPNVRDSVVLAREDQPGKKRLVAYVVPRRLPKPTAADLRQHLQTRLPDYMIPMSFTSIEKLPLTINGKLDRAALPKPTGPSLVGERTIVAPRNAAEAELVALWEELLDTRPIGVEDDFFEMGGDSLVAMRLMSLLEQRLGQRVPMAAIFRAPTIGRLAALLSESDEASKVEPIIALRSAGTRPPLFFFPLVDGYAFYPKTLMEHLDSDQPVYCLQPLALNGRTAPQASIEAMATSYIQEMRRIQPRGPYYLCGYCFSGITAYEVACQICRQGEGVALLALVDSIVPGAAKRQSGWRRLAGHARKMRMLAIGDRLAYFGQRMQGLWRRIAARYSSSPLPRTSETVDSSIAELLSRIEQASLQAVEAYTPQAFPGRITLIQANRTEQDDFVDVEPLDGWGPLAGQGVEVIQLDCGHTDFFNESHAQALGEQLRASVAAATRLPPPELGVLIASLATS